MLMIGIGAHRILGLAPRARRTAAAARATGTTREAYKRTAKPPTTRLSTRRARRRRVTSRGASTISRKVPQLVRRCRFAVDEQPVPPLEREQRPDHQPVVYLAFEML